MITKSLMKDKLEFALAMLKMVVNQCKQDKITITAGHLAYVSLLSLVPFIMVFFSVLSAFPAFARFRGQFESFIFSNFVPTSGDVVQKYVTEFVGNASQMGATGVLFLVVVALLLISNVDRVLNQIWRTSSNRAGIFTFAIYWMVLTLGPLLIGSSLVMTSYLVSLTAFAEDYTPGISSFMLRAGPLITAIAAFFILYMVVPNKRVTPKHALAGAIMATLLFELSKKGFAAYVSSFPSYEMIYGALAAIPILFVWIYLSWIIVLAGAEFTYSLEVFTQDELSESEESEESEESDLIKE